MSIVKEEMRFRKMRGVNAVRPSKYRAEPTIVDGIRFASKAEARRYGELLLLQKGKVINLLKLQPRFRFVVNGIKIGEYWGDFQYFDEMEKLIVEDVKSPATKTPVYRLKKKLLLALYNIQITEV